MGNFCKSVNMIFMVPILTA